MFSSACQQEPVDQGIVEAPVQPANDRLEVDAPGVASAPARMAARIQRSRRLAAAPGRRPVPLPPSLERPPEVPEVLCGRYRLERLLARGGTAAVYRARDELLGSWVAVKQLLLDGALSTPQARSINLNFRTEALAAMRLSHPRIVRVFNFEVHHPWELLIMELVEGETLRRHALQQPECRLPPLDVLRVGVECLEALIHAHQLGVVHHDIKPSNILIGLDGGIKLCDFGLAKSGPAVPGEPRITAGTPGFMSPERLRGEVGDRRSDLFSLGATLYALANAAVFPLEAVERGEPVDAGPLPQALHRVLMRATAPDPVQRYQSAGEMRLALLEVRRGLEHHHDLFAVQGGHSGPLVMALGGHSAGHLRKVPPPAVTVTAASPAPEPHPVSLPSFSMALEVEDDLAPVVGPELGLRSTVLKGPAAGTVVDEEPEDSITRALHRPLGPLPAEVPFFDPLGRAASPGSAAPAWPGPVVDDGAGPAGATSVSSPGTAPLDGTGEPTRSQGRKLALLGAAMVVLALLGRWQVQSSAGSGGASAGMTGAMALVLPALGRSGASGWRAARPVPWEVVAPVRFSLDAEEPVDGDPAALAALASRLGRQCQGGQIIITGHTCGLGEGRVNQRIGLARARSVSDLLQAHGLEASVTLASQASPRATSVGGSDHERRVTVQCAPGQPPALQP